MKTIKLFITIIALAIATTVNAVEKPKLNVVPLSADRAIVSAINANDAHFEISVKSKQDGATVYYKQSNRPISNYQRVFDFKGLENGKYVLRLQVDNTVVSREFDVNFDEITVSEQETRYAPYFRFENGNLKFSYLNFEKEPLKFKIYKAGELVYKTKLGSEFAVSSGYDLNQLENGKYLVQLASANEEYNFELVK